MIQKYIIELNRYRQNKGFWKELAWCQDPNSDKYIDLNYRKRCAILIALQFDKKPTDEELIKHLLSEATKHRANDPFQGCSEELNRAGFLLAEFKNPANVELFLKAKTANFDTHCAFDWEHILSAGVKDTFEQIENSSNEVKVAFHSYFNTINDCELSDEDIAQWLSNKQTEWYPNNIQTLSLSDSISLALELGDDTKARKLLAELELTSNKNIDNLLELKFFYSLLNDTKSEIELTKKIIQLNKPGYEHFIFVLSDLYLKINDYQSCWDTLKSAFEAKNKYEPYILSTLADTCINLINKCKENYPFLDECYQLGLAHKEKRFHLFNAQETIKAAKKMNDETTARYYENLIASHKSQTESFRNKQ